MANENLVALGIMSVSDITKSAGLIGSVGAGLSHLLDSGVSRFGGGAAKMLGAGMKRAPIRTLAATGLGLAGANELTDWAGKNTWLGKQLGVSGVGGVKWNPAWHNEALGRSNGQNALGTAGLMASHPIQTAMSWLGQTPQNYKHFEIDESKVPMGVKFDAQGNPSVKLTGNGRDAISLSPDAQALRDQVYGADAAKKKFQGMFGNSAEPNSGGGFKETPETADWLSARRYNY